MNFLFGKKVKASSEKEDSHGEGSQRSDDDQTSAEGDGPQENEREVEAFIHASEGERKALLNGFDLLRKESLFCDATFLCHDVLFRAHKVVLSSWSRWMRTFLADSSSEEVLSLDIFMPEAFRSVLDYMYGHPLVLTVEVADDVLKVVRRLELSKLEQHCWRYLMTSLDRTNCHFLHELADKYDCPPLKLAAWKLVKSRLPPTDGFLNYEELKDHLSDGQRRMKGTGLTGPGDPFFAQMGIKRSEAHFGEEDNGGEEEDDNGDNDYDEDNRHLDGLDNMPSVFNDYEGEDDEVPSVDKLSPHASATEVIMAWAKHLKTFYSQCAPIDAVDNTDLSRLRLDEKMPNVRVKTKARRGDFDSRAALPGSPLSKENTTSPIRSIAVGGANAPMALRPSTTLPITSNGSMNTSSQGPPMPRSAKAINWAQELEHFYTIMKMPEKIGGIKTILRTWAGKEDAMITSLLEKYDTSLPRPLIARLEQLQQLIETQTEHSFK